LKSAVKDLAFILSELSTYLQTEQYELAHSFLGMKVALVSTKTLLEESGASTNFFTGKTNKNEELLNFGCQSITNLLNKVVEGGSKNADFSISVNLLDKIFQMFIEMRSKKVRQKFSEGLLASLSTAEAQTVLSRENSTVRKEVLEIVVDLNAVKTGLADIDLDFDKVLGAIQKVTKDTNLKEMSSLEINLLTYSILFLLTNQEFSVRDYAEHAFGILV